MTDAIKILAKSTGDGYPHLSDTEKRSVAVAAALELISAYAASGNPKFSLSSQMKGLSGYADLIQAAIDKK